MTKLILATLVIALLPVCAFAVDGVVLINQSTVVAAGGFPYVIAQPGSYKLTGNLVCCTPANSNAPVFMGGAIQITAKNVTLDLNGFSIVGPSSGFTVGIFAPVANHTTILNGSVSGFSDGVTVQSFGRVQNMHVFNNDTDGIDAGPGSLIVGNVFEGNQVEGISVGAGSLVKDNTVSNSLGTGIFATCPSAIVANVASGSSVNIFTEGAGCTRSLNSPAP
jgi:hypothetical protein